MKITLCGSLRFEKEYKFWNRELTLRGHVVHTVSCYPSDNGGKAWYSADEKIILDVMHLAKIDVSDAVVIIDTDMEFSEPPYIGESTQREIAYAKYKGKRVIHVHTNDVVKLLTEGV